MQRIDLCSFKTCFRFTIYPFRLLLHPGAKNVHVLTLFWQLVAECSYTITWVSSFHTPPRPPCVPPVSPQPLQHPALRSLCWGHPGQVGVEYQSKFLPFLQLHSHSNHSNLNYWLNAWSTQANTGMLWVDEFFIGCVASLITSLQWVMSSKNIFQNVQLKYSLKWNSAKLKHIQK